MALAFLLGQLAIFSELQGEVGVQFLLVGIAGVGVSGGVCTGVAGVAFIVVAVVFILVGIRSGVVVHISALAFVVGALRLQSGRSFSGHLRVAFPITRINGLGEGMEFGEGVGFADVSNFILDSKWEPMAQLSA